MPKKYNADGKRYKRNFKKNVIFVCNHNSFQDSFVVLTSLLSRRVHLLMARDVMKKLGYFFYSHIGCIPIDRENIDIQAFNQMCQVVDDKRALVIFPEGKLIDSDKSIAPIRSGAILVANKTHTPIVPVYVQPNPHKFHRTKVIIGEPIKPYNEKNDEINADDIER
jgi:1-acyl-sn-glycerol-3-phosphate acyltransferase